MVRSMVHEAARPDDPLFSAVAECARSLVCVFDREGRIVVFNPACEQATGFAGAEVLGVDARACVIPPEEANAFASFIAEMRVAASPNPQVGHWLTRDGARIAIAWTNRPVTDDEGRLLYLVTHGMRVVDDDVRDPALREQLRGVVRLAHEQAALRRVATLAAASIDPEPVFQAVSREAAVLLGAQASGVFRFEGGDVARVVGRHADERVMAFGLGTTIPLATDSAASRVYRTGATASIAYESSDGGVAAQMRSLGFSSSVGAPIVVHGRLWGVVVVVIGEEAPDAVAQAEEQLGGFAELVGLAVAEADAREELLASRARIVRASDDERRRLERNLHDGAQQRLVSLAIRLRLARRRLAEGDAGATAEQIESACDEIQLAVEELRQLANGLHPALLTEGGVGPALEAVARGTPLDVRIEVPPGRFEPDLEAAVYYVAAEALTNAVKHARATRVAVAVEVTDGAVSFGIEDDGAGGADERSGTGLRGLRDRIEALRGTLDIVSPQGGGTTLRARLPRAEARHAGGDEARAGAAGTSPETG